VKVQKRICLYTSDGMKTEFQAQNYRAWTIVYDSLTQSILDFYHRLIFKNKTFMKLVFTIFPEVMYTQWLRIA